MNDTHKKMLASLARTNHWGALLALRDTLLVQWQEQGGSGATEFEYLSNALRRDGKIEGVNAFIQSIENMNNV